MINMYKSPYESKLVTRFYKALENTYHAEEGNETDKIREKNFKALLRIVERGKPPSFCKKCNTFCENNFCPNCDIKMKTWTIQADEALSAMARFHWCVTFGTLLHGRLITLATKRLGKTVNIRLRDHLERAITAAERYHEADYNMHVGHGSLPKWHNEARYIAYRKHLHYRAANGYPPPLTPGGLR